MASTLALGHLGGLKEDPLGNVFLNASALMTMNRNYRLRGEARPNFECLEYGFTAPSLAPAEPITAIAFHVGHDANFAMSIDGEVQCVLELERWFGERYYHLLGYGAIGVSDVLRLVPRYRHAFLDSLEQFLNRCDCGEGPCPRSFDYGVLVEPHMALDLPKLAEEAIQIKQWRFVHHHEAHAMAGFLSSPFRRALVVSYDGGGDDGFYNAFYGSGASLQRVARLDVNFAGAYNSMTDVMAEIYPELPDILEMKCAEVPSLIEEWVNLNIVRDSAKQLSDAGKIMGYAAVAADREPGPAVRRVVRKQLQRVLAGATLEKRNRSVPDVPKGSLPLEMVQLACNSTENQELLAAELQRQWQRQSLSLIRSLLRRLETSQAAPVEGLVLMGGCALNVVANQFIQDSLGMEVFVPSAPSDCGLAVGALFSVSPPVRQQPMQYLGFHLWDLHDLPQAVQQRAPQQLSQLGGAAYLARLLATPKADGRKPILAIVRGRQEYGPRALGHRSLVAVPDEDEMKRRMNRLKFRKWYRPCAPMIAEEALEAVFGRKVLSRYMERAPKVLDWVQRDFPAMVHFDGTARHQSVGHEDEPWLHQLLLEVGKLTGLAALINTSFNTRGKPIVNTIEESLKMLDTLPDLDYVLIEDYLFAAPANKAPLPLEEVVERKNPVIEVKKQVPNSAVSGRLSLFSKSILRINKNRVTDPRSGNGLNFGNQIGEPLLEDLLVRMFFSGSECRVTFGSNEEAMKFYGSAVERYERQTAAPSAPAPPAPLPAPRSPEKTGPSPVDSRKRKKSVDDLFMQMSTQGREQLTKYSPMESGSAPSSKRRDIDSRTTSSPDQNSVLREPSRMMRKAPAPPSSILQRRPSNPPQDSSIYGGYRPAYAFGLQNLGNTCYLNAVTQAISSLREFVEDLRAMPNQLPDVINGSLFKCTVDILKKMQETTSMSLALSPAKLREQIAITAPMFQGNGQQDAHEFFLEYMNQLHDELLRAHKASEAKNGTAADLLLATQSHFDAEVERQLTCVQCGQARTVVERFRDFSLDFSGAAHAEQLPSMLRRYFQPELLEAKCEHCHAAEANLDTNLREAPRVLVLHLKRFVPNMEKQCYEKQHQAVDIPYLLDLGATLSGHAAGASPPRMPARPLAGTGAAPAPESPETSPTKAAALRYGLRAIVAHEGASPRSGHYVCYAKSASGAWCLYDDSRVTRLPPGEEPRDLGRKAYMLFYVLNSPSPASPSPA